MNMRGSYAIPAPREIVWAGLNDIEILKASIPGCELITKHSETELEATVYAKVGPVKAKFTGTVSLSELNPPNGYTISGEGKGGAAGFAKGGAKVKLEDDGRGTALYYEVDARVGGKLAQIGSRLIDAAAKKMADQFFSTFSLEIAKIAGAGQTKQELQGSHALESSTLASLDTQTATSTPKNKRDPLNDFQSISAGIWLLIVSGLFALGVIWLILG
ncbi:MAG: CoxG family protein [Rhodospirillaceae bacterium]